MLHRDNTMRLYIHTRNDNIDTQRERLPHTRPQKDPATYTHTHRKRDYYIHIYIHNIAYCVCIV